MQHHICATCGVQFAASAEPPGECPICEDARQWVPEDGQRWTTLAEVAAGHRNEIRDDFGLTGIGTAPRFAIGQRALVVPSSVGNVLWECVTLLDEETAAAVEELGGLAAIAISHPHYYSSMVEWAHRFECPVLLHADDAGWIMRPDDAIELWDGETRDVGGLELLRLGGHFPGGTVMLAPGGRLLSGDIVQVIPDRGWVSFMYSYPNLIPLPAATVLAMAEKLKPYAFESIQGAWWDTTIRSGAKAIVTRSAERYARALAGDFS
jgi:glyoxylase-like metal-dependent hydrolase (beta-lactamase superfamily II)